MKQEYYGDIDLTKLGNIVRKHNSLVRKIKFKDGEHQLLKISILIKDKPDKFGNTATIKVNCKRDEELKSLIYFVGDLKGTKQDTEEKPQYAETPVEEHNDLPF